MPAPVGLTPAPANPQPFNAGPQLQPAFDLIELLPERAAERIRALRQRSSDTHSLIPKFSDVQEASTARQLAEHRLRQLQAHPQDHGFNLPPTDTRVIAQQKLVDKLAADFKRLQELQTTRSQAFQTASGALSNIEAWLKGGRPGNTVLEEVETELPKLAKGEATILDAIENRRRRVRELKADLHRIESSCYPSAYCKQRMREQVEALAQRGAPVVSDVVEHDRQIIWPTQRVQAEVINKEGRGIAFHLASDSLAVLVWLQREEMLKKLDALVSEEADDKAALSVESRQTAAAEVSSDILAVERVESTLVFSAQSQGLPIEHRSDISPLALLGLALVTAPRAADGPSSIEHALDIVMAGR